MTIALDGNAVQVLVVDDSKVDRRLAGGILGKIPGLRVTYAENGHEALDLIERDPPKLVLTDLQMPTVDGLQLVEALRMRTQPIPSILMTAHGSEEIAIQALRNGAASYVPKRNLARDLAATVQDVLASSQPSQQQLKLHQCWTQTEFQFRLDNDTGLIPLLVAHLQQYLAGVSHCDQGELVRVGVALHEALRNAMHHGNLELSSDLRQESPDVFYELAEQRCHEQPYGDRRVQFVARESPHETSYLIRDEGPGFDTSKLLVDPTQPENLTRLSGRGLFLIQTFMHDVRFNDRGNELTMVHRRAAVPPPN